MSRSIVDGVNNSFSEIVGVERVCQFEVDFSAKLVGGQEDTYSSFGRFVAVAARPLSQQWHPCPRQCLRQHVCVVYLGIIAGRFTVAAI